MTHMDRLGRAALGISLIALVEVKVVDQEGARRLLSDFSLNNNDHSRNQVVQPSCQAFSLEVVKKGDWTFFLPLPVGIFLQRLIHVINV